MLRRQRMHPTSRGVAAQVRLRLVSMNDHDVSVQCAVFSP